MFYYRILLLCIFFNFLFTDSSAQHIHEEFDAECSDYEAVKLKQEKSREDYKSALKKYKHKKQFLTKIEERQRLYLRQVDNQEYFCDARLTEIIDELLTKILHHNPELKSESIEVKVGRYPWVNASFIGDNTIIINLGLLTSLNSSDELAFVLSHELAHYYLDHLDNDLREYVDHMNSKETIRDLRKIKRSKYNRYSKAERLLKNYVYDHRTHSRNHEFEADSLGYLFFEKSGFNTTAAVSTLNILDKIDSIPTVDLKLREIFDFDEIPFRNEWLAEKKTMFGGKVKNKSDWNIDSLKTHPQCAERISILKKKIKSDDGSLNVDFGDLKSSLMSEVIRSNLHFGRLDYAFIEAIKLYNNKATSEIGATHIIGILEEFYSMRLDHEAGDYVGNVNKAQNDNIKDVRKLLKNIRTKHLALLRYHFINENIKQNKNYDNEFSNYHRTLASMDAELENKTVLLETFKKEYPNSQYKIY